MHGFMPGQGSCVLCDWQVAEELQSGPMSTEEKELLHLLTSPHLKVNMLLLIAISLMRKCGIGVQSFSSYSSKTLINLWSCLQIGVDVSCSICAPAAQHQHCTLNTSDFCPIRPFSRCTTLWLRRTLIPCCHRCRMTLRTSWRKSRWRLSGWWRTKSLWWAVERRT